MYFLMTENFTYKESCYVTISRTENKTKNLLKVSKKDFLEVQIEEIKVNKVSSLQLMRLNTEKNKPEYLLFLF